MIDEAALTRLIEERIVELSERWNAVEAEAEALWQANGKPQGKAWKALAEPVWARQEAIEDELAPLLLAWAEEERLAGLSIFGFFVVDYAKVRKATGLKMHGTRIRNMLAWARDEANRKALAEKARAMSEAEWEQYEAGFCTTTQEGKNTLAFMRSARTLGLTAEKGDT